MVPIRNAVLAALLSGFCLPAMAGLTSVDAAVGSPRGSAAATAAPIAQTALAQWITLRSANDFILLHILKAADHAAPRGNFKPRGHCGQSSASKTGALAPAPAGQGLISQAPECNTPAFHWDDLVNWAPFIESDFPDTNDSGWTKWH